MKRLLALLLALCMVCCLFGCGAKDAVEEVLDEVTKDTVFEKHGFSITLPAYAVDNSAEETATEEPYQLIVGKIIICAIEFYKEDLGVAMTAAEYAQLLVDTNGFDAQVEVKDGISTFTFTSTEDDLTYLCITLESDNALWFVNASCDPDDFAKNSDTMWTYLRSAKVTATGEPFVAETEPAFIPVTVEDLTINMPASGYTDITDQVDTDLFAFAYMLDEQTVIMGMRQTKDSLGGAYANLEEYAYDLIEANGMDCTVEYRDGIPTFVFDSADGEFTYQIAAFEGTDAYWAIQGYSFADTFSQVDDTLWQYLSSAVVS